jgi:hypothetical protein
LVKVSKYAKIVIIYICMLISFINLTLEVEILLRKKTLHSKPKWKWDPKAREGCFLSLLIDRIIKIWALKRKINSSKIHWLMKNK